MPHIIIEHSSDISSNSVTELYSAIQNIMASITEGNFDPDQCKCRSHSFDEYFVGRLDQKHSSFLHITIKILAGRNLKARKELGEQVAESSKKFFDKLTFSPSEKDQLVAIGHQLEDVITGIPHPQFPVQNSHLAGKRCDISVDIVEMDKETYQKMRIEN